MSEDSVEWGEGQRPTNGAEIEVVSDDAGRVVAPIDPRPHYLLTDLLVGMTPDAAHSAFDWGPDVGREDAPYVHSNSDRFTKA